MAGALSSTYHFRSRSTQFYFPSICFDGTHTRRIRILSANQTQRHHERFMSGLHTGGLTYKGMQRMREQKTGDVWQRESRKDFKRPSRVLCIPRLNEAVTNPP